MDAYYIKPQGGVFHIVYLNPIRYGIGGGGDEFDKNIF